MEIYYILLAILHDRPLTSLTSSLTSKVPSNVTHLQLIFRITISFRFSFFLSWMKSVLIIICFSLPVQSTKLLPDDCKKLYQEHTCKIYFKMPSISSSHRFYLCLSQWLTHSITLLSLRMRRCWGPNATQTWSIIVLAFLALHFRICNFFSCWYIRCLDM